MEPRARAGKNVGKMNFSHNELAQLLFAHGDSKAPLGETVRVLDEIVTDFIQAISCEATRVAHHAGRQKVKFDDFQFAMRRNPRFMGKIQETFDKKKAIESARKGFDVDEQMVMRDAENEERHTTKDGPRGTKRARVEEELGEGDDDLEADADIGTAAKKR